MANETKYFKTPFAESGTRTEVPNASVGGAVGFDTGFGSDYELPQGSAGRKRIERDKYNGLHHSITKNLKQWQEKLYPTWIEDDGAGVPFAYPQGMVVNHAGSNWASNEDDNQEEPGVGAKWDVFDSSKKYRSEATLSQIASGKFLAGELIFITDRDNAEAEIMAGGTANGSYIINADNGNTALIQPTSGQITIKNLGAVEGDDISHIWPDFVEFCYLYGCEGVVNGYGNYLISDSAYVSWSGVTITFTGGSTLKLTAPSSNGAVLVVLEPTGARYTDDVTLNNPQVDGSDFGYPTGGLVGENGVAGANCRNVRVNGGRAKNCRRGINPYGGKGIQFENGVYNIKVDGFTSEDCTIAMESGGTPNDATPPSTPLDFHTATLVKYTNMVAIRCDKIISLIQTLSPPVDDIDVSNFVIDGVMAFNCGRNSITGTELDAGPVVLDRTQNASITGVRIYNDSSYGKVSSAVKMRRGSRCTVEVDLYGDCDYVVSHQTPEDGGTTGQLKDNYFKVRHFGSAANAITSLTGDTANLVENSYDITTETLTSGLMDANFGATNNHVRFTDSTQKYTISGLAFQIIDQVGNEYVDASAVVGSFLINKVLFSFGATGQSIASFGDQDLALNRNQSPRLKLTTRGYQSLNLPTYATNALAITGGLVVNDEYKTATGERRIVV